jgi:hypothetical protein
VVVADAEEAAAFGGVDLGTRDLLNGQNLVDGMEHCGFEVKGQGNQVSTAGWTPRLWRRGDAIANRRFSSMVL